MAIESRSTKSNAKRETSRHETSGPRGLYGILETLAKEHREVAKLLEKLVASSSAFERQQLFPQLRTDLLAHEQSELEVLYPMLRRYHATKSIADDHHRESEELAYLIEQLDAQPSFEGEAWHLLIDELAQMVKKHVRREETEFWPLVRATLGEEAVSVLDWKYRDKKREVRERVA